MRKLIYHVATSIDGYIAQENDNIDLFPTEGDHIQDYVQSLTQYDMAIMGRRTYQFGYRYGMKPGDNPYPHMSTYVYSKTLQLDHCDEGLSIITIDAIDHVRSLKETVGATVYLCGGGILAKHLLDHQLIDEVHLKLSPIIIGSGIPLFDKNAPGTRMALRHQKSYNNGVLLLEYVMSYD